MLKIKPETTLKSLGFDSLDMTELLINLEEEFDMDIEATTFEDIKSIIYFIGDKLEQLQ